ncbi:MAG: 2-polyprenyl-6-hydroxyphenyl methylase/3-demethylubiquinone-9 3-methyltransferase [Polaribacter sp.]|jgi:2-polyprenyl-6-hydroxyphenyl methylase/3-demethylubiquinone-9 3-methyltransferase
MKDLDQKERFKFGNNWKNFLEHLDDERIEGSKAAFSKMLGTSDLTGNRFLDVGSGSGLSSLVARKMGAEVFSFDYDDQSVECTKYLKEKYFKDDPLWNVEQGSVLNASYMKELGEFDIVYSWGVLHHTGNMHLALANVDQNVKKNGTLFIAIYNDQNTVSNIWRKIKSAYVKSPKVIRFFLVILCYIMLWGKTFIYDLFFRGNPFYTWKIAKNDRGMSKHYDLIDWVGGYPFEVATPDLIFNFYKERNYRLEKLRTHGGGHACNEFIFTKL